MSARPAPKITGTDVRNDFNALAAVLHYTRAAHFLGLWESERRFLARHFPDQAAPLLEAGCGAGRVAVGLWHEGYRDITGFDFAEEPLAQARALANDHGAAGLAFLQADATRLEDCAALAGRQFAGVLFLFNGLMQIPGRGQRRAALAGLRNRCLAGGRLLFTTHDRDCSPEEGAAWVREAATWAAGTQDPRLREFGDRYFAHEHGHTFMHLPDRAEILADLAATGWTWVEDALRDTVARESPAVRDFSDNCRFWVAANL